MGRILNTRVIERFDPSAIRDTLVEVADGIYLDEQFGNLGYFADIPVNRPVSEILLDQLFAESYIDSPVCQYGGHVIVEQGNYARRFGAGEIKEIKLSPSAVVLSVQPNLPEVDGVTETGFTHEGEQESFGLGRLRVAYAGGLIQSNMSIFVQKTGKFRGAWRE